MRDFGGGLGRRKWPLEEGCIISFVGKITFGPFGVSVSFNNYVPFVTMLMVALELAQASSLDGKLKPAEDLAVAMGIEDAVVVLLEIRL